MKPVLLERYRSLLPITVETPIISLGEGDTPLVRAFRLEAEIPCGELYFKLECCNPTGSFKDRGMVMAVAKALEGKQQAVMCASTGNTSASAAAYAARSGLACIVLIPQGAIAQGKLAQVLIHGAKVLAIDGNFDQALHIVRVLTEKHPITLVNSLNPHRLEGQKTAAFEIVDALGDAPDYLFIPVGNAGNITAYWKGFTEYGAAGKCSQLPHMMGYEAEGAAAIVFGHPIPSPQTVASAIRIGNPASWKRAEAARDESRGCIDFVSDEEILSAYVLLARREGVFGEPASAASLAGLLKAVRQGLDLKGKRVVCIITGNGLKDPETALKTTTVEPLQCSPDVADIERVLGLS
ncbi:MAG: threonine synthase [Dehalococcoidia bacterium]|nr:threonine synthase [Dehalococcoidia bacterium]